MKSDWNNNIYSQKTEISWIKRVTIQVILILELHFSEQFLQSQYLQIKHNRFMVLRNTTKSLRHLTPIFIFNLKILHTWVPSPIKFAQRLAKIWLSKLVFYVKIIGIFLIFFPLENNDLEAHFLLKWFLCIFNFETTFFY